MKTTHARKSGGSRPAIWYYADSHFQLSLCESFGKVKIWVSVHDDAVRLELETADYYTALSHCQFVFMKLSLLADMRIAPALLISDGFVVVRYDRARLRRVTTKPFLPPNYRRLN